MIWSCSAILCGIAATCCFLYGDEKDEGSRVFSVVAVLLVAIGLILFYTGMVRAS